MPEVITKEDTLEILDMMIKIVLDPDSVDADELEQIWPSERIAQYLEAIKGIVASSGMLV